jgi:hypothetical protein
VSTQGPGTPTLALTFSCGNLRSTGKGKGKRYFYTMEKPTKPGALNQLLPTREKTMFDLKVLQCGTLLFHACIRRSV